MISDNTKFLMSAFFTLIIVYYAVEIYDKNKYKWKKKQK